MTSSLKQEEKSKMIKTVCAKSDYMLKHPKKKTKMRKMMELIEKLMKVKKKPTQKKKESITPKKPTKKYLKKPKLDLSVENH